MITYDMKNYKAREPAISQSALAMLAVIALIALLGWMGERDHQAKVEQIKRASAGQCR